jgi:CheY-like chemotaxis protein
MEGLALTAFISHSFENEPEFENVADCLDRAGVPYWKPAEIKSGASLRTQLRQAVKACSVCIFVATHRSVDSSWCGAELGAFWGAGIPVIVYLADSSLPESALPPVFQGDVWERKLARIAERAAELIKKAQGGDRSSDVSPTASVSSMTVEQLEKIIAGAVSLVLARESADSAPSSHDSNLGSIALEAAGRVLRAADAASHLGADPAEEWRRQILWVDDRPNNNIYERQTFEALGFTFVLALSTDEALEKLTDAKFGAIISDMGRREGPREGYRLLEAVRGFDDTTPYFIYAGSRAPEHIREAVARGAQGCTNRPNELIDIVVSALERKDTRRQSHG